MNRRIVFGIRTAAPAALLAGSLTLLAVPVMADTQMGPSIGGGVGEYHLRITNAAELGSALDSYSKTNTA